MTQRGRRPTRERQARPRPRVQSKRIELGLGHFGRTYEVHFGRSVSQFGTWDQAMEWANWLAEPTDRIPL